LSIFESHHSGELLQATLPAAGAAVAQDQAIGRSPITGTVVGASVISEAAVTANGTNFRTIRVLNKGQDGLGTTVVASLALDTPGTDNLVAFDEKALDLSGTASKPQRQSGRRSCCRRNGYGQRLGTQRLQGPSAGRQAELIYAGYPARRRVLRRRLGPEQRYAVWVAASSDGLSLSHRGMDRMGTQVCSEPAYLLTGKRCLTRHCLPRSPGSMLRCSVCLLGPRAFH
jgi:hypothetical protein